MLKSSKFIKIQNLKKMINNIKKKNKKIILCHGCFDILHWGHAIHFNYAKKYGDILIVSITKDKFIKKGKNRPIYNQNERAYLLSQLFSINYVTINNIATAEDIIKIVRPNFYVKGEQYKLQLNKLSKQFFTEKKLVESFGGKVIFSKGKTSSSTLAVNKLYNEKKN
jgi:rfaE bifunctional protein nucleotidyltransferase chain/domain